MPGRELQRRRDLAQATLSFRGGRVRFGPSAATIDDGSRAVLQEVRRELQRDPVLRVVVKGFADRAEPDPAGVSAGRADAVVAWLVSGGIAPARLRSLACGDTRPLSSASAEESRRAANRRVEIVPDSATAGCQPPFGRAPRR